MDFLSRAFQAYGLPLALSVLRNAPACPWWPYVWSQHTAWRVGDGGKAPVRAAHQSLDAPPPSTVLHCLRPDRDIFYLRQAPNPEAKPLVLPHCPFF